MTIPTGHINDFYRGDTKSFKFEFVGLNVTGWELWFTMKVNKADSDSNAIIQVKTIAGDNALDDPVNGLMYVTLTSEDTFISPDEYFYDFQRVIPGTPPDVNTLTVGIVNVLEDITISNI